MSHTSTRNDSLLSASLYASGPRHSVLARCRGLSQQRANIVENKQPSKLLQTLTFPSVESQNQDSKNNTQGTAPTIVLHTCLGFLTSFQTSQPWEIMGSTKLVEATPVKLISVSYTHIYTYISPSKTHGYVIHTHTYTMHTCYIYTHQPQ